MVSLFLQLDIKSVQNALQQKRVNLEYFSQMTELWELPPFNEVSREWQNQWNTLLDVKSNYFQAKIEIVLFERKRQLSSGLLRQDRQVWVQSRSLAPF